jgi:hypothetical protein
LPGWVAAFFLLARPSDARIPLFLGEYFWRTLEGATEGFFKKKKKKTADI